MITVKAHKKFKRRAPGGKITIHIKKKKAGYAKCGNCGSKLNRKRLNPTQIRKIPKNQRKSQRPLPHLCPSCMKLEMKNKARGK